MIHKITRIVHGALRNRFTKDLNTCVHDPNKAYVGTYVLLL